MRHTPLTADHEDEGDYATADWRESPADLLVTFDRLLAPHGLEVVELTNPTHTYTFRVEHRWPESILAAMQGLGATSVQLSSAHADGHTRELHCYLPGVPGLVELRFYTGYIAEPARWVLCACSGNVSNALWGQVQAALQTG